MLDNPLGGIESLQISTLVGIPIYITHLAKKLISDWITTPRINQRTHTHTHWRWKIQRTANVAIKIRI